MEEVRNSGPYGGSGVDREALAVVAAEVLVGVGVVLDLEVLGVPLDGAADAQGDDAEQDGLGEPAGVVEVGHGPGRLIRGDRLDELAEVAGRAGEARLGLLEVLEIERA